jgi:hypothetical protein
MAPRYAIQIHFRHSEIAVSGAIPSRTDLFQPAYWAMKFSIDTSEELARLMPDGAITQNGPALDS